MAVTRRLALGLGAAGVALGGGWLWRWQDQALSFVKDTQAVAALRPFGKTVRVQNVDTFVVEAGSGPPVLLIHGIPDTVDVWVETILALKERFRCIAFDLPGFGQSHAASSSFDMSIANRPVFLQALLEALGVAEPVRLIAHDAGGTFGVTLAAAQPRRVERALFSITSMHPDFEWRLGAQLHRTPLAGELAMAAFDRDRFRCAVRDFSGPNRSVASIDAVYERIDGRMKRAILAFYRATSVSEFAPWQARFEAGMKGKKLRVIWGELNPGADIEIARKSFPGAVISNYADVGHWPMLEAPAQWSTDVRAFLAD